MKHNFNWGDDTIDSRDINNRYEELNDDYQSLVDALDEAEEALKEYNKLNPNGEDPSEADLLVNDIHEAQQALDEFNQSFEKDELDTLIEVVKQGEDSADWYNGEGLILEEYFTDYIKDLVKDCYEMPEEFESGSWPWRHMEMNWEDAAEEAKDDYNEIEVEGYTYLVRA